MYGRSVATLLSRKVVLMTAKSHVQLKLSIILRTLANVKGGNDLLPCHTLPLDVICSLEWPYEQGLLSENIINFADYFGILFNFTSEAIVLHPALICSTLPAKRPRVRNEVF